MSAKERFQAMSSIFISHSAKDKATEISAPYPLRVEADRQEHRCLETQGQRPDLQGSRKRSYALIDVASLRRGIPDHCPAKVDCGLANVDHGYVHSPTRRDCFRFNCLRQLTQRSGHKAPRPVSA
jgi:hypothetical protein